MWIGQYSSERHLKQKLLLFNTMVESMEDWIIIADSDEFQDYGGERIPDVLAKADRAGASYIKGELTDRWA